MQCLTFIGSTSVVTSSVVAAVVGASVDSFLLCRSIICCWSSSVQLLVTTCSQESPCLITSLEEKRGYALCIIDFTGVAIIIPETEF